jgi:hypothetical protein
LFSLVLKAGLAKSTDPKTEFDGDHDGNCHQQKDEPNRTRIERHALHPFDQRTRSMDRPTNLMRVPTQQHYCDYEGVRDAQGIKNKKFSKSESLSNSRR